MRSPEAIPVRPPSVLTRTMVASKCTRGWLSQLALKGGASGSRWGLIVTALILCPQLAGSALAGRSLMFRYFVAWHSRIAIRQPSTAAPAVKAEKFTTRIEKRHWSAAGSWREAWVWERMRASGASAVARTNHGDRGAQENHRPALAAAERAARVRGRRQARQLYGRGERAADLAERAVAPRHRARAPHRHAAVRAPPACAHPHQGRPAPVPGSDEVLRPPRARPR